MTRVLNRREVGEDREGAACLPAPSRPRGTSPSAATAALSDHASEPGVRQCQCPAARRGGQSEALKVLRATARHAEAAPGTVHRIDPVSESQVDAWVGVKIGAAPWELYGRRRACQALGQREALVALALVFARIALGAARPGSRALAACGSSACEAAAVTRAPGSPLCGDAFERFCRHAVRLGKEVEERRVGAVMTSGAGATDAAFGVDAKDVVVDRTRRHAAAGRRRCGGCHHVVGSALRPRKSQKSSKYSRCSHSLTSRLKRSISACLMWQR